MVHLSWALIGGRKWGRSAWSTGGYQDLRTPGTRGSRPHVEVSPDRQTFLADGIAVNSGDTCHDSDKALAADWDGATTFPGKSGG